MDGKIGTGNAAASITGMSRVGANPGASRNGTNPGVGRNGANRAVTGRSAATITPAAIGDARGAGAPTATVRNSSVKTSGAGATGEWGQGSTGEWEPGRRESFFGRLGGLFSGHRGGYGYGYGGGMGSYGGGMGTYSQRGQFAGRGPKNWQRSDERIKDDVSERLSDHPDIDASEIEVQVKSAEVTLIGTVDERDSKRLAEDIAQSVSGVKDVHNQIRVEKPYMKEQGGTGTTSGSGIGTMTRNK